MGIISSSNSELLAVMKNKDTSLFIILWETFFSVSDTVRLVYGDYWLFLIQDQSLTFENSVQNILYHWIWNFVHLILTKYLSQLLLT